MSNPQIRQWPNGCGADIGPYCEILFGSDTEPHRVHTIGKTGIPGKYREFAASSNRPSTWDMAHYRDETKRSGERIK